MGKKESEPIMKFATIASLFCCFPLGLVLLWTKSDWPVRTRAIITALFISWPAIIIIMGILLPPVFRVDVPVRVTSAKSVRISGTFAGEGVVRVNGKIVKEEGTKFETTVPLRMGENVIRVEYQPPRKRTKYADVKILRVKRVTPARLKEERRKAAAKRAREAKASRERGEQKKEDSFPRKKPPKDDEPVGEELKPAQEPDV